MSEPENNPPPDNRKERESVIRILDELVSHMNTSRNVAMVLIISAFILTPLSLVLGGLLLSAPSFGPWHEIRFREGNFSDLPLNLTDSRMISPEMERGSMMQEPPRFMTGGGPLHNRIFDISVVVIIFIAVSFILSSILLYIGIREFLFYSKWNKKFSKFTSLREKIDKELGDEK